jgi:hypothetical protein
MKLLLVTFLAQFVLSGSLTCTYMVFKARDGDLKLNYHKSYEPKDSDVDKNASKADSNKLSGGSQATTDSEFVSSAPVDSSKKVTRSLRKELKVKTNRRSTFFQNEVIDISTASGPRVLEGDETDKQPKQQDDSSNYEFEKSKQEGLDPTLLYLVEITCRIQDGFTEYTVDQDLTCAYDKKMFSIEFQKESRLEVQSLIFANAFEGKKSYVTDEFNQEYIMASSLPLLIADNGECKLTIKASWISSIVSMMAVLMLF